MLRRCSNLLLSCTVCLVLYLGTNVPLETSEFDEKVPGFYVGELPHWAAAVQRHFNYPLVYYVGSDTGCGCGFDYDPFWRTPIEESEPGEEKPRKKLSALLGRIVEAGGQAEVFMCWNGDEGDEVAERLEAAQKTS